MKEHDVLFVLTSVFVGPLIATMVFCLVAAIVAGFLFGSQDARVFISYLPVVVMAGYFFGAIPALIGSIVAAVLSRYLPGHRSRLLLGSFLGLLATLPVVAILLAGSQHLGIALSLCPAGAIAGLACVSVAEWMLPRPAPAPPAT